MASNDESHRNQTLRVQLKLDSILIRAIIIIPSGENQVREVLDHNIGRSQRPHLLLNYHVC